MTKKSIGIVFVLVSLALHACAPVYIPNAHSTPLFRRAGEFQTAIHIGQGIDAQGAVSITNHIGVMGGYNYVNRNTSDTNDDKYVKHSFWEAAVGYYGNENKISYEFFGGYGRGEGTSHAKYAWFGPTELTATGTYQRFFIQPSIGTNHNIFNWIVSTRMSLVDFEKFAYDNTVVDYNNPVVFFEPAFTGRVYFGRGSPIYSQFQTAFSFTTQGETVFDYQPFQLSFGIGLRLGRKPKLQVDQADDYLGN
jgi:hypothetical protein